MFSLVVLLVVLFLFYWIIGGVFFACMALLKLKKIYKVRFSCLFTFTSAVCAGGATWSGIFWSREKAVECLSGHTALKQIPEVSFSCGFGQLFLSAIVGLIILLLLGFGLLKLSSRKDRNWLTAFAERLEYIDQEEEKE